MHMAHVPTHIDAFEASDTSLVDKKASTGAPLAFAAASAASLLPGVVKSPARFISLKGAEERVPLVSAQESVRRRGSLRLEQESVRKRHPLVSGECTGEGAEERAPQVSMRFHHDAIWAAVQQRIHILPTATPPNLIKVPSGPSLCGLLVVVLFGEAEEGLVAVDLGEAHLLGRCALNGAHRARDGGAAEQHRQRDEQLGGGAGKTDLQIGRGGGGEEPVQFFRRQASWVEVSPNAQLSEKCS